MPLILDPVRLPKSKLLEMLQEQREILKETIQNLDAWPYPVIDAASFRTAGDLLTNALALTDSFGDGAPVPPELLARVINLDYDATLAAIDLMKSHSQVPSRVPRAKKTAEPSARAP